MSLEGRNFRWRLSDAHQTAVKCADLAAHRESQSKQIHTMIAIIDLDAQKCIDIIQPEYADAALAKYRSQGYSVLLDRDGDICIDRSGDDAGLEHLTYSQLMER